LHGGGYAVMFYEDLPYALHADRLETRMKSMCPMDSALMTFSMDSLEKKLTALQAYVSQIPSFLECAKDARGADCAGAAHEW
jgi:hypothetical protein